MRTCLGRKIERDRVNEGESLNQLTSIGFPQGTAKFLYMLEAKTATWMETLHNGAVERLIGRPPQLFDSWVQENKAVWQ